jgi:outer membrane protein assembly factor BamB
VYTSGGWQCQGLYAINVGSGSVDWVHQTAGIDIPILQVPPAVDDDGIVFAISSSGNSGGVAQIRYLTPEGEQEWRWESPVEQAFISAPVITETSVFATVGGFGTVALDRATGTLRWNQPHESYRATGGKISAPAIADGTVYATSSGRELLAMTPDDGTVNWRLDLGLPTLASPVIAGDQLYIGTTDRSVDSDSEPEVFGINRTEGTIAWRWTAPNPVTTAPSAGDGTLFVTTDNQVHALA